jgi:saccharopine dehydrogenase-like NADP-dependent oxidoreductase
MDSRCSAIAQLDALVRCRAVLVLLRCPADAWCSGKVKSVGDFEDMRSWGSRDVGSHRMIVLPNLGHQHLGHDLPLSHLFLGTFTTLGKPQKDRHAIYH